MQGMQVSDCCLSPSTFFFREEDKGPFNLESSQERLGFD